ncbi:MULTISPECIES: TauD/TfdA dioxygenase family protein [unclassified Streptomyces]|uniref:TauD/TfdA dioxygenase family protein n=1 Tax=unclassified Streptomyces TaxID=2593676 RepID=UPI00224F57EA|nr:MULTISPECIES: TauD/TfdA family dioxygenase [unclassified Streptomyces]MCX4912328.1 TauD/TfdA family dioxygenase [Streptomyces sp. NBC_00687]MCX5285271.1 TauD/TfdA family dioxygenase [Streptomyces sp. NBC_00198]WSD82448.1 TauD/TfdA family dioxygenase [Streptomyces sp. NBC_01558]WSK65410.1 TauD/TfdA family dioxygenase [Streptomyces sp. NBC_01281]
MDPYALEAVERITTRPAEPYETITVDTITPLIGAEVSGVDLNEELTPQQEKEIRAAFLDHHVLVFRDQDLTTERHKRFAALFGELHPVALPEEGSDPHILEIRATKESRAVAGNGWHADGTADAEPSLGSMLHITTVPEGGSGGDTLFANMHLAYELLSPAMRTFLDGLTAVHDGALPWMGQPIPPEYDVPRTEHPVVVRHADTGRKLLFVNGPYTSHITQLSRSESTALLDMLYAHIARTPLLQCRVRWQPRTLVFWDNRCVQHHAVWDYFPHSRYGRRVAINGTRPQA